MIFSRYIRKLAAVTAVLGLLFAQFTVAAYACPLEPNAIAAHVAVESSGPPCHQGKDTQGSLCEAHCQDGQKNVPAAHTPPAADFVAAFIVTLPAQQPARQTADAIAIDNTTPHHSPPILLRNACFRI